MTETLYAYLDHGVPAKTRESNQPEKFFLILRMYPDSRFQYDCNNVITILIFTVDN